MPGYLGLGGDGWGMVLGCLVGGDRFCGCTASPLVQLISNLVRRMHGCGSTPMSVVLFSRGVAE